jgi:hypothetical protein
MLFKEKLTRIFAPLFGQMGRLICFEPKAFSKHGIKLSDIFKLVGESTSVFTDSDNPKFGRI